MAGVPYLVISVNVRKKGHANLILLLFLMRSSLLLPSADSLLLETADSALDACIRVMAGIGRLPTALRPVTSILNGDSTIFLFKY